MQQEIKNLIAEARDARHMGVSGYTTSELFDMVDRLADALEATLGEPTEAHDTGMGSVDWDMIRDGVADPEEAASVAVRAALKAAGVVPVRGGSSDDRGAILRRALKQVREIGDAGLAGTYVHDLPKDADSNWGWLQGMWPVVVAVDCALASRATAPDAATELIAAIADELTPGRRDKDLIIAARGHKAERDAAVAAIDRVRKLHEPHETLPLGCEYCGTTDACDTRKALDGAPEPEWEAVAEYGVKYAPTNNRASYTVRFGYESREDAEHSLGRLGRNQKRNPDRLMYREVRTGPWLPVEGEKP